MDGFTRQDHVAGYETTDAERLPIVISQLGRELASAAKDPKCAKCAEVAAGLAEGVGGTATAAEDTLRLAIARDGAGLSPPPPHRWLAPLVEARETFLPELLELQADLRPLVGTDPERDRGAWRSPSPFE